MSKLIWLPEQHHDAYPMNDSFKTSTLSKSSSSAFILNPFMTDPVII